MFEMKVAEPEFNQVIAKGKVIEFGLKQRVDEDKKDL